VLHAAGGEALGEPAAIAGIRIPLSHEGLDPKVRILREMMQHTLAARRTDSIETTKDSGNRYRRKGRVSHMMLDTKTRLERGQ
jgi:hypothetical protein